ncbi:unnamed protein product [Linum trigynum]|uniref:Uncharacterized protein n=1 Tax=Linum trigynum TaxID=586398 RepID=A0AAV2E1V1_9ROSI
MPVGDPSSGQFYIWIISIVLFMAVTLGGSFLIMYLILPPTPSTEWLPVAGVSLVCLPWGFWFVTCVYRVLSRTFGFRVVIGGGGGGGGGSENNTDNIGISGSGSESSKDLMGDSKEEANDPNKDHHQFVGNVGENGENDKEGGHGIKRTSSSANGVVVGSNESEMPLTSGVKS